MGWKVKYFYFLSAVNALSALIGASKHDPLTWVAVIFAVMCWFIAGDLHKIEKESKNETIDGD